MAELISAPESTRPALVVDVDGVLRVDSETKPDGYVRHPLYPVFSYNPDLREPLGSLLTGVDAYYISGWRADSHGHGGEVLLLPEFDWINDDPFRPQAFEFSERALAIDGLLGNRPVAWLDDEIDDRDMLWARERQAPTLLIQPEYEKGLQLEHVAAVGAWLISL